MKMNYRRDNSPGWKKPALLAALVLFTYLWGSSFFADTLTFVTYPFLRFSGEVSSGWSEAARTRKDLVAENGRLKRENEGLKFKAEEAVRLERELSALRGFASDSGREPNLRPARVLVRPGHLPYDELIIDLGTGDIPSLASGRLVFAERGVVIGQVEQVFKHFAKVKLYSTGGMKIPVAVGENGEPSIAEGRGAGNFALTLPRGLSVDPGDPVRTTLVGDYALGYVGQVDKDPNDPFQKVFFRSPYNVFELNWVFLGE